ncbi:NAD-dependent epimerase/dehydratase family protein [Gemmatimonadota bacterium]
MVLDRRTFLRGAALSGAGLALGAVPAPGTEPAPGPNPLPDPRSNRRSPSPKRILILGGTGFIGPSMVRYAVERGHEVSIFTRGRTQAELPEVEHLIGDRNDDLNALRGRRWDVVLDNNARDYRWVRLSTELLKDSADHYLFVSSISAFTGEVPGFDRQGPVLMEPVIDEDSQLFSPPDDFEVGQEAHYGLSKTLGEQAAQRAFPDRSTVVRPGLIVGPGDPTDRFTYWPVRIHKGGEVLAPGTGLDPAQIIDVRDLTEWIVRLAEDGVAGVFNATGPQARLSMAEMLYGIRAITPAPVRFTWLPLEFLTEHEVRPWSDMPAWMPAEPIGFVSVQRAVGAGLTFRPLAVTARDTLDWHGTRPADQRASLQVGLTPERESEVLRAWHESRG